MEECDRPSRAEAVDDRGDQLLVVEAVRFRAVDRWHDLPVQDVDVDVDPEAVQATALQDGQGGGRGRGGAVAADLVGADHGDHGRGGDVLVPGRVGVVVAEGDHIGVPHQRPAIFDGGQLLGTPASDHCQVLAGDRGEL